jgi:hypothetical protein
VNYSSNSLGCPNLDRASPSPTSIAFHSKLADLADST